MILLNIEFLSHKYFCNVVIFFLGIKEFIFSIFNFCLETKNFFETLALQDIDFAIVLKEV